MSTMTGNQPAAEVTKVEVPSIPNVAESSNTVATPSAVDEPKLSAAEKKKLQKAEKQARRAKAAEQKGETVTAGPTSSASGGTPKKFKQDGTTVDAEKTSVKSEEATGSNSGKVRSGPDTKHKQAGSSKENFTPPKPKKHVLLFNHLPQRKMQGTLSAEDMKGVHQDVRILGLKMIEYMVLGSNARLVAMLTVLKTVISEYRTPEKQALTRHIIPKVLSPQISHLNSCRPLSVSQGNAIRWLKLQISKIDVSTPENEAKAHLCKLIDEFIRDKSTLAHQVIAEKGAEKIKDGDVVLTYANSTVVEKTIKKAWADGKRFRLMIIDSREPLREGLKLAESLRREETMNEMRITFGAYNSVSNFIDQTTKVFLGAHAMMTNGSLYSRVGTAAVALEAHTTNVPVIVLCESVKFSDKAPLNSFDMNELAPLEEMFEGTKLAGDAWVKPEHRDGGHRMIRGIADVAGMNAFNLMYDLTPADWINMVISEHGAVPPTSVPVLNRLYNEANEG